MSLPLPIRAAMVIAGIGVAALINTSLQRSVDEAVASEETRAPASTKCHPSYTGACVPSGVADVDCANIGADGPYYVRGPIRVVGRDVYRLDEDGDGEGCEPFLR